MPEPACGQGFHRAQRVDVLLVAEDGHSGGIGRYCVDLAQSLRGAAAVACLCPENCGDGGGCWLAAQCRSRGVRLVPITMPPKAWTEGFKGLTTVWVSEGRPILHVNGRRGNLVATLAKARYGDVAFVTTVHGVLGLHSRRNAAYRAVDLVAGWAADCVIAVSADTRRWLAAAGMPPGKTITISNGLGRHDMEELTAVAQGREEAARPAPARVGFLGRFGPEKGIEDFVKMAWALVAEGHAATFVVAGSGPLLTKLGADWDELIAQGLVEYSGDTADPVTFLAGVDVLVMPSRNEGMPYVLLEGLAAGCAVAAYGVGGIPEVISDASMGRLVRPGDLGGLVRVVSGLVDDPALCRSLGRTASQQVSARYGHAERLPSLLGAYRMCDAERARRITAAVQNAEERTSCAL